VAFLIYAMARLDIGLGARAGEGWRERLRRGLLSSL
jgi:hypothetical protein